MKRFVALLFLGALFVGIAPTAEAQSPVPLCTPQPQEQMFWFDDFRTDRGWTTNNDPARLNQWQRSEVGEDDGAAYYVGRGAGGGETGYVSSPNGRDWNVLTSPVIDANLWDITCVQVDLMGSSEGAPDGSDMTDWLQVDIYMPGMGTPAGLEWWQGIASFSGQTMANDYTSVGAPIKPSTDISDPPLAAPPPSPPFPAAEVKGQYTQIRLAFTMDGSVDSFSPPCTREFYEANGNQCTAGTGNPGAPAKLPAQNMAGYGWFVDNVKIYGTPIPPPDRNQRDPDDRLNYYPDEGPEIESFDVELQRIDIIEDAGQEIPVIIRAKDDTAVVSADVFFVQGNDQIQVILEQDATRPRDWMGILEVDDVRLLVGEWTAVGFVADERGNLTRTEETYNLQVTADRAIDYPLNLGLAGRDLQNNPEVALAAGGSVQIILEEDTPILRDIRFQVLRDGFLPPPQTPIGDPYILTAEQFPQGEFTLALMARDRAHQTGFLDVEIINDQTRPVLGIVVPPVTYQNVEFPIEVWVKEQTSHEVRFQMDGQLLQSTTNSPAMTHTFNFTRTQIESGAQFKITVNDRMANQAVLFGTLDTIMAPADAGLQLASVPANPTYLPGDQVQVLATITDRDNPRDYPYELNLMNGNDVIGNYVQNVAPNIPRNVLHTVGALPPGLHTIDAFARVDASYPFELNEDLDETEEASVLVEVYLGRTIYDNQTWYIRADGRGQAYEAVDLEFDFHYPLRLRDTDNGTLYLFDVGAQQLYWNPLNQTTYIGGLGEEPPKERPVPGLPLMVLLGALALAARRKR